MDNIRKWQFNKNDLESFIKKGEQLLQKDLKKCEREKILTELKVLQEFIKGNYDYEEPLEQENIPVCRVKDIILREMKRNYKTLGPKLIDFIIYLEKDGLFNETVNQNEEIDLSIEEQEEWTIKNYERHSRVLLPQAKQLLNSKTPQIQQVYNLNQSSFTEYFHIVNLPLIVVDPEEAPYILNHELQHGIERSVGYQTHQYYMELGPIYFELLFNDLIYDRYKIQTIDRLDDISLELSILSEYFILIKEFAKHDFKVSTSEFRNIFINTLDIIPEEFEDYLKADYVENPKDEIMTYLFSHLKAIELIETRNPKKESLNTLEPFIITPKFHFEINNNLKIYENYTEKIKQKILKR